MSPVGRHRLPELIPLRQQAMNQDRTRDFWKTVLDGQATLCALLDASATEDGRQEAEQLLETLCNTAIDINPLLMVEMAPVPVNGSTVLRIVIGCDNNPDGIEAVRELVAAAPAMPPRIQICAFAPPLPKEVARQLTWVNVLGTKVQAQKVRFLAEPSTAAPGTFDLTSFVPSSAVSEFDPKDIPGSLVTRFILDMGIGELRLMTRVSSIGVALTDQPPPEAVQAWDLVEIIDSALAH